MDFATATCSTNRHHHVLAPTARRAVFHACGDLDDGFVGHDLAGKRVLARRLAALLGYDFTDESQRLGADEAR